jgi:hypothetical protein
MSYDKPELLTTYAVPDLFAGASGFASGSTGTGTTYCDGGIDANPYICIGIDNIGFP